MTRLDLSPVQGLYQLHEGSIEVLCSRYRTDFMDIGNPL